MLHRYITFNSILRIDVQDKARRLGSNPHDNDQQTIEQKRQSLVSMLAKLRQLQSTAGVTALGSRIQPIFEDEGEFDDFEHSSDESASATVTGHAERATTVTDVSSIEREVLALPSNKNVAGCAVDLEIRHRITQARRQVGRLRDIIADISFQYSHVIRGQVRKSVRTTAQKRVKSLHNDLVLHARIYRCCRSRLVALNCEERLLRPFRVLTKGDLKASTAILRPNIPGSSSVQLSWIWHTGRWYSFRSDADADAGADPASLLECL
jgi:hypothetical protein